MGIIGKYSTFVNNTKALEKLQTWIHLGKSLYRASEVQA